MRIFRSINRSHFPYLLLLLLLLLMLMLVACTDNSAPVETTDTAVAGGLHSDKQSVERELQQWPVIQSPLPVDVDLEARIDKLLSAMTLRQKIGQMIQAEIRSVTADDIKTYQLGAVLNGGGSTPNNNKRASAQQWVQLAQSYFEASMHSRDGAVAIPILWGTDAVHGHNNVYGATIFPHNIGLGAANDPALIERIGAATALEVAATGINWIFAPTLAVARDDRWGRTYESYSEDPQRVVAYAGRLVEGIQGVAGSDTFLGAGRALATAKHFVADGGTVNGIDRGDAAIDEAELRDIHAVGYIPALRAGVQTVMASFSSWQGQKLHGHHYLLTEVLKQRMGFDGFIIGDWNGHAQLPACSNSSCAAAINAGVDMLMAPNDWKALFDNTLAQVDSGEIALSRIDDAVRRILRVKMRAGLFASKGPAYTPAAGQQTLLAAPEHRALAREAVRKSLVLLKNDNNTLPLAPSQRVLVAGSAADDIGRQCGGWSLSWQGRGNSNSDFPNADSIVDGIRQAVQAGDGEVVYSADGSLADGATVDVAIAVFGETPYAEMQGDIATVEYQPGNKTDLALLKKLQRLNVPVVSVFITGRPLWVNAELNQSDAFVVAWLPGSEGGGIADVLFKTADGAINSDFTASLSFSWPARPDQTVNRGDTEQALFPYGYGLSYGKTAAAIGDQLPEQGMAASAQTMEQVVLFDMAPPLPWQLYLQEYDSNIEQVTQSAHTAWYKTISIKNADRRVQEDVRSVSWDGARRSEVLIAVKSPMDFTPYASNGVLSFDVLLNKALVGPLQAGMICGDQCSGAVTINSALEAAIGQWKTITVPLRCLQQQGVDLTQVTAGFVLSSESPAELLFGDVRLSRQGAAEATIRCR